MPSPTGSEATTPSSSPSQTPTPPRKRRLSPDRNRDNRAALSERFLDSPVPTPLNYSTGMTWRQHMQERRERHAAEMEHSRQQVAQQLHVHFGGSQQEDRHRQQQQPPSPGLTPQEVRELRQVREYWREIRAMALVEQPPQLPRRQPPLRPPTEETSFSRTNLRTESPLHPPRGIRTLVGGRYPEASMTEEEIREKLPHSPRTPPHLLPQLTSRIPGSPQLRPRHQSCLLYTSPSPRDGLLSRMPSSA